MPNYFPRTAAAMDESNTITAMLSLTASQISISSSIEDLNSE
jgi:hypothetical protein